MGVIHSTQLPTGFKNCVMQYFRIKGFNDFRNKVWASWLNIFESTIANLPESTEFYGKTYIALTVFPVLNFIKFTAGP
jgi:hypothetical protein